MVAGHSGSGEAALDKNRRPRFEKSDLLMESQMKGLSQSTFIFGSIWVYRAICIEGSLEAQNPSSTIGLHQSSCGGVV